MKILIVGSGSREHALAWHFRQDPRITSLFIAPGNAGTAALGENLPLPVTDVSALTAWASVHRPDLTFVGPEAPLCAGIVDAFQAAGLPIFGPNQKAAQLEASKSFTKALLLKYGIPTGTAGVFTEPLAAYAYSQKQPYPQVIKADGLAAGKGVIIAQNPEQAVSAIYRLMEKKCFGEAGTQVLIEQCLFGQEVSLLVLTDGESFRILPPAQDHKRLRDHDQGPNTGGMGAYAPASFFTPSLEKLITETIIIPTLHAFKQEGLDYQGVLFIGLMLTAAGPQVLEFNVRLGDPETQVILPLLETSLYDLALAVIQKRLSSLTLKLHPGHVVGIVLAAENYPETPRLGDPIEGLAEAVSLPNRFVFHGGTALGPRQTVLTAGGRVLTVAARAENLASARDHAYHAAAAIQFSGRQYRRDIGSPPLIDPTSLTS
jgi:phosphoribosylamine---glycine ligase